MGFVDRHERDRRLGERATEPPFEAFGRDVDELVFPGAQAAQAIPSLLPVEARVEHGGAEPVAHQCVDLVLHEGNERAHDDHRPGEDARGDLIRERLPGTGRHDADAIAPGEHRVDELLLPGTKLGVAEDAGQDVAGAAADGE